MVARGAARLNDACRAIADAGAIAGAFPFDVSDIATTRELIAAQGPFDILVNAAGLARHGPAFETREAGFDTVTSVSIKAAYFAAQAVAQGLIAAGRPRSIIQISSQMGHVGGVDRAVYCATKHAVEGMTKAMAMEWGPYGIRANTICPTFILTPLTQATLENPERRAWIESKIRLGRVGEVEDIMGAVLFLASDASALVTGTALRIDGGWTAG